MDFEPQATGCHPRPGLCSSQFEGQTPLEVLDEPFCPQRQMSHTNYPQRQADKDTSLPRADQGSFGYTPSQAATTEYASSMATKDKQDDDAQTTVTSYTYQSHADAEKYLKRVESRVSGSLSGA